MSLLEFTYNTGSMQFKAQILHLRPPTPTAPRSLLLPSTYHMEGYLSDICLGLTNGLGVDWFAEGVGTPPCLSPLMGVPLCALCSRDL